MTRFVKFLIFVCLVAAVQVSSSTIETVLDLKTRINRLVPKSPGELYAASTNHLYKIVDHAAEDGSASSSLRIDIDLTTGPKMQQQQCAVINPSFASPNQCIKYVCDDEYSAQSIKQVDNENRLLLIDEKSQNLIECGSVDYGGCRLRDLSDLSIIGCNYSAPVIPFDSASGVIVSSTSSLQYSSPNSAVYQSSLYLMVSIEYDPAEESYDRSDFPVFSVRHLATTTSDSVTTNKKPPMMNTNQQQLFQSKYLIESMNFDQSIYTPDFHFKIVYSFNHNGFIYFLYTITNKILPDSCNRMDPISSASSGSSSSQASSDSFYSNQTKVITRLLRICDGGQSINQETLDNIYQSAASGNSGANLATLTETVMDCDDPIDGKFHLLQSAHFHRIDSDPDSSILFMTFNRSRSSAVCKITVQQIDDHFMQMLDKCMKGDNEYGELVSPYSNKNSWKTPCRCSTITDSTKKASSSYYTQPSDLRRLFCQNDLFNYMNSRKVLTMQSIEMKSSENRQATAITSVTIDENQRNSLVLVISDTAAQLSMFVYDIKSNMAIQYDQISLLSPPAASVTNGIGRSYIYSNSNNLNAIPYSVQAASSIGLYMTGNSIEQKYLFATYDKYLYKINLKNCGQYDTCHSCLYGFNTHKGGKQLHKLKNPFCGWCIYDQKCTLKEECSTISNHPSQFLTRPVVSTSSNLTEDVCPRITDVKPTRFLNPVAQQTNFGAGESFVFELNTVLSPQVNYYCDLSLGPGDLITSRVEASIVDPAHLKCNLTSIKGRLENAFKLHPIVEKRLVNVSVQLRARAHSKSTQSAHSIIANTNLLAFNCTHFSDCNQCLSKQLGGSCVWCARNSKCTFSSDMNAQCPNEIDFFTRTSSTSKDLCTSFSIQSSADSPNTRFDIPYSADASLSNFTKLFMKNAKEYQKSFICLFSKTKYVNPKGGRFVKSNLVWLSSNSDEDSQMSEFDCSYSAYSDLDTIDPQSASQTVYMSVWWSPNPMNKTTLSSKHLSSLNDWYQVKFKPKRSIITNALREYDDIPALDLTQDEDENLFDQANSQSFVEIKIVNCNIKASSCGQCMDPELMKLGCGWCSSSSKCTMKKDCFNSYLSPNVWMNDLTKSYCPNPTIQAILPKCGPKIGSQLVIIGENLGHTSSDVRVKMRPMREAMKKPQMNNDFNSRSDMECEILPELYTRSSQIVCQTPQVNTDDEFSVFVETNIHSLSFVYSSFNQTNQFMYKYVTPKVLSIEPKRGIKSGGTNLKISGKYLSCGVNLNFKLQPSGLNCSIINVTRGNNDIDVIYCRTPAFTGNSPIFQNLEIQIDAFKETVSDNLFRFEYIDDPRVTSIKPGRTIASGGIVLTVVGRDFDSLQTASLILASQPILNSQRAIFDNNNIYLFKSKCSITNSTNINCVVPQIRDKRLNVQSRSIQPIEYSIYIEYNDLNSRYANLQPGVLQRIQVYPDPIFDENQVFSDKTQIILIRGQNLLFGIKDVDYRVFIGPNNLECNVTSITMNLIACILPDFSPVSSTTSLPKSRLHYNPDHYIRVNRLNKRDLFASLRHIGGSGVKHLEVRVTIGAHFSRTVGLLRFDKDVLRLMHNKYDLFEIKFVIAGACSLSLILFLTMIGCFVVLKRRQNRQIRQLKRMQTEFENLEMRVARECKEAFTELQMDIGELVANTLNQTGAPFNNFTTYCVKILFPNATETERLVLMTPIDLRINSSLVQKENLKNGVSMLSHLMLNKRFLLTFIHTLESDTQTFLLQDRVNLASYISICLFEKFDYFTDILMTLLSELIEKVVVTKNNPKILFRRNESIAEKMLSNWFAFLLYEFIHDCAGTPLYILFLSIKQQIYKGPVDAITCEARYSLSEDKLIRQSIDYEPLIIRVQLQQPNAVGHSGDQLSEIITVKVLNCDTITQVKEKILDSFFKGYPFSKRPRVDELDLIYIPMDWANNNTATNTVKLNQTKIVLQDEDKTSKNDCDDLRRLNTLAHYKIINGSLFYLIPRHNHQIIMNETLLDPVKNAENMTLLSKSSKSSSSPPTYSKLGGDLNTSSNHQNAIYSIMNGSTVGLTEAAYGPNRSNYSSIFNQISQNTKAESKNYSSSSHHKIKRYHLIKPCDSGMIIEDSKLHQQQQLTAKLVSEVYLTRLLATKGGMQSFVDDFFESVFSTAHGTNVLPFAIKYMFDFLDDQAARHGITDPDVVYTWKSNSLPLRFWVNIIKNPDFVFDIHKSGIVDASLSVIASTFMDSCSQSRLDLNKESPSGKLLFYKEVHKYRKWVESYYSEIRHMPRISEQELSEMLNQESRKSQGLFNKNAATTKLYNDYIKKYRSQIESSLNENASDSVNKHLNYRLQQVVYLMDAIDV